ncbi:unnamed protein product [Lymnaea stagnalis]|uniref:CABIT domain-containing protein n=1 Tax=Lymnaea stagnalis TaxID=6523 RepID=A0AAV2HRF9_LYMST
MLLGSPNMAESWGDSTTSPSLPTNVKELLWEERSRTLRELLASYRLPLAVKLKSGDISKYCAQPAATSASDVNKDASSTATTTGATSMATHPVQFTLGRDALSLSTDGTQRGKDSPTGADDGSGGKDSPRNQTSPNDLVLQIHETRRKKIILARKMTWEKRQNDYVVTGEQVEIPASYKGWLEVVPDDGRPVEYFDTIGGITSIKCKKFLLRTSAVGHLLKPEDDGSNCWIPVEIKPGEVMTTGIIYTDSRRSKNSPQKNIFKRLLKQNKLKKESELKYLQCFDVEGREIMIPLIMNGVFSPVGDASMANYDAVYELQDLIIAFGLPVNVQLIHSSSKENYQCPRGVLRLYGAREEELAVVSRIGSDGALVQDSKLCDQFEIPVDKELLFSRGVVKKKPLIKPKLVETIPASSLDKMSFKYDAKDSNVKVSKDVHYSRSMSLDVDKHRPSPKSVLDNIVPKSKPMSTNTSHNIGTQLNVASDAFQPNQHTEKTTQSTGVTPATGNTISPNDPSKQNSSDISSKEVTLPERAPRELKKSRSTGILDKLSVRKVKKERAKLKELRGDDVFSKRIARSELSYQEFYNGLGEEDSPKSSDSVKTKQEDSGIGSSGGTYKSNSTGSGTYKSASSVSGSSVYGLSFPVNDTRKDANQSQDVQYAPSQSNRKINMKDRDLPPIPLESPNTSEPPSPIHTMDDSKESLYEHLPPAPKPPSHSKPPSRHKPVAMTPMKTQYPDRVDEDDDDDEEDGYMVPIQSQETRYAKKTDYQLRNRPSTPHDSYRNERTRKARSEHLQDYVEHTRSRDGYAPDIDTLFNFTYNEEFGSNRPLGSSGGVSAISTSHLYGASRFPSRNSDTSTNFSNLDQRFMDNLDLETRNHHRNNRRPGRKLKTNPNATIRSHNLRKVRPTAMDAFGDPHHESQYGRDSTFVDQQNNYLQNVYDQRHFYPQGSRPVLFNSRSVDPGVINSHYQPAQSSSIYSPGSHYAESEPCFHNHAPASVGGLSEMFPKQGDDSAISMCSRGEGGYPNDSEYSYSEYMPSMEDDGWTPPDHLEGMSVQEVSKSLRYIGMKDRVVLRFSNEQIDGSMLCTLDQKLLKEGFPELNALEVKKVMDFIQGWRPKKS